jgi:hypothetical protein
MEFLANLGNYQHGHKILGFHYKHNIKKRDHISKMTITFFTTQNSPACMPAGAVEIGEVSLTIRWVFVAAIILAGGFRRTTMTSKFSKCFGGLPPTHPPKKFPRS